MLTRHTRLIAIVLTVAVLIALGGSTVLAQGPTFPTPKPPTKAPASSSSSAAPAAPKVPPTVAPVAPGSKAGPATAPIVKPVQPQAQPRTSSGTKAVPGPMSPWVSAFRVQNLGSATASCSYTFYDAAGGTAYASAPTSVNVGDSLFVYTPGISSPTFVAGQYSGVVSCDQQVAAVVNYMAPASAGAGSGGDVYSGVTTMAATWYAPNIFNNYFQYYTNVIIQNATGAPNTINMAIYAPGSSTAAATQTCTAVPAYASCSLDQSTLATLSPNVAYSAVITGGGNIAPIVNIYGLAENASQQFSYNAFTGGGTTIYAPVVMKNYSALGYLTAITVMNVGTAATNVTVTYGTGQTENISGLAANSSHVFYTPSSPIPNGSLTSATITSSSQNIVVLVNERTATTNRATSYNGFTGGTATARAPIVMRRYADYNTSVTCQNVGTGPTTMTLSYGGVSGTENPTTPANPIPVGGTALFYQPSSALIGNNFIGSATVSASGGGASIVCVVNEDMNEGVQMTTSMDQLYGYNAIGQ